MANNPYARPEAESTPFSFSEPRRTSGLAIASLVLSILGLITCPAMVLGVLGFLLGVVGLFFISSSNGRLGGRGLALSGVIVGLLSIAVGMAVWIGGSQLFRLGVGTPARTVAQAIRAADRPAIRGLLTADADATVTDAELDGFILQAQGMLGSSGEVKAGLLDFARAMIELEQSDPRYSQSSKTYLAVWVEGDAGKTMLVLEADFDAARSSPKSVGGFVSNIGVRQGSNIVWLRGSPFP